MLPDALAQALHLGDQRLAAQPLKVLIHDRQLFGVNTPMSWMPITCSTSATCLATFSKPSAPTAWRSRFIISSATPAIIVYAQELMPHRLGMISGLFYGMAFGFGGIGAAVLGQVADWKDINFVYQVCAFLPAIGLLAIFLPQMKRRKLLRSLRHCERSEAIQSCSCV